jgi:hypothetical protein
MLVSLVFNVHISENSSTYHLASLIPCEIRLWQPCICARSHDTIKAESLLHSHDELFTCLD